MRQYFLTAIRLAAVGVVYIVLAQLGFSGSTNAFPATLIWPASGFGAFVIWRYGRIYVLPIFIASLLLHSPNLGFWTAILFTLGRVAEPCVEAFIINKTSLSGERFGELRDAVAVFAAAIVGGCLNASIELISFLGTKTNSFSQLAIDSSVEKWLASALGFAVFFSLFRAAAERYEAEDRFRAKVLDTAKALLVASVIGGTSVLLLRSPSNLAFLCASFPLMILVAGFFSPLTANASMVTLILSAAYASRLFGSTNSAFAGTAPLNLQIFFITLAVAVLVLQGYIRMIGRRQPVTVMLTGAIIGATVMWFFVQSEGLRDREHAQNIISVMSDEVTDRSHDYERALSSTAAFWETYQERAGEIPPDVWENYSKKMKLPQRFPRLRRIGLMLRIKRSDLGKFIAKQRKWLPDFHIRPIPSGDLIGDGPELYIVSAPSHGTHASSYGLDYASEKRRKDAADYAAEFHVPKISDRLELASTFQVGQPAIRSEGFTMMFPLYLKSASVGWALAAYSFDDFFAGATRSSKDEIAWSIAYASDPNTVIFRSAAEAAMLRFPLIKKTSIVVANTNMVMSWYQMPGFASSIGSSITWLLIVIVSVSIAATATMTNLEVIKTRAVQIAERISHDLEKHRLAIFHSSKMSSLGHMAAGIAHEINNPLTVIIGLAHQIETELVKTAGQSAEVQSRQLRRIERINFTASRIAAIIRGLQSFSRSGASVPRQLTPVATIVDTVLELSRQKFMNTGIDLRIGHLPTIEISVVAVQIEQVLMNLLINSFDAVQKLQQKWIEIDFELCRDWLTIVVTDSGHGLPDHVAARIMEPFFTTKPVGEGTGLGLSICQGILESHGGKLVYAKDAAHTQFRIKLPVKDTAKASLVSITPNTQEKLYEEMPVIEGSGSASLDQSIHRST